MAVVKITLNELKSMVNTVCTRILNESMSEGGAAGHMDHPFDINEFTFDTLKRLVYDLFNGNISEDVSEKLDGMNTFATVTPTGSIQFARNKKQIEEPEGGMGIPEMEARWGGPDGDLSTLNAYKNAYYIFSEAVKKLKDPIGFFNGDGYKIYANCEVIDPGHPNIIHYDSRVFSIHGLVAYSTNGPIQKIELPEEEERWRMDMLKQLLPTVKSDIGKIQTTPKVSLNKIEAGVERIIEKFEGDIEHLKELAGIGNDNARVVDYKKAMLRNYLGMGEFKSLLSLPDIDFLLDRWSYSDKTKAEKPENLQNMPTLTQLKKKIALSGIENAEEMAELYYAFEKTALPRVFEELMIPLKYFVYELGNEAIKLYHGFANEGNEEAVILSLRQQLEVAKETIRTAGDPEEDQKLTDCLNALNFLGDKINSMEGIVFNYEGHTVKLTGSFAALNRAINNVRMKRTPKN